MTAPRKVSQEARELADKWGWNAPHREQLAQAFQRALDMGERRGLERAAEVAETFPTEVLQFYERPGSPPGNQYRLSRPSDVANAIFSLAGDGEGVG